MGRPLIYNEKDVLETILEKTKEKLAKSSIRLMNYRGSFSFQKRNDYEIYKNKY